MNVNNLAAWELSPENFPVDEGADQKLLFILNYAILAPSTHNTQPWLFRLQGHEMELLADTSRALPIIDPVHRELVISCGAALHHLQLACRYFGYNSEVEFFPDPHAPNLLAKLSLGLPCETRAEDILLFNAIQKRRTNRTPFLPDPIPPSLLAVLKETAAEHETWFHVVEDEEARFQVADLVSQADRTQWKNKAFRQERAAWTTPNTSPKADRIPGYAQGLGELASQAEGLLIRTFDRGKGQAACDRDVALHSPVLAILGTETDSRFDWLRAGQAISAILLRARIEDVWVSFLNQAIEVPETRSAIRGFISQDGSPQLLLRLGFGQDVKPTPRRSTHNVLLKSNVTFKIHSMRK